MSTRYVTCWACAGVHHSTRLHAAACCVIAASRWCISERICRACYSHPHDRTLALVNHPHLGGWAPKAFFLVDFYESKATGLMNRPHLGRRPAQAILCILLVRRQAGDHHRQATRHASTLRRVRRSMNHPHLGGRPSQAVLRIFLAGRQAGDQHRQAPRRALYANTTVLQPRLVQQLRHALPMQPDLGFTT